MHEKNNRVQAKYILLTDYNEWNTNREGNNVSSNYGR